MVSSAQYTTATEPRQPVAAPPPVQVFVAPATRQRRLTVLVRAIGVVPHAVILYFLQIAAWVVAFIGWWGALFTGRLPGFAGSYLTGYVRWYARVMAYMMLLTDAYPPFSMGDRPEYPVRIATTRERLNRFAVFFRPILIIPASIVAATVAYGALTVVLLVSWLIVVVTGKLPASLHLAYTSVLRYETRLYCYGLLLTPAYPVRGLLGDGPAAGPRAPVTPTAPDGEYGNPGWNWEPGYGAPGYGIAGYGTPGDDAPAYGAPQAAPHDPALWRLFLTRTARRLVIFFIVFGCAMVIAGLSTGFITGFNSAQRAITTDNAIQRINRAHKTLSTEMHSFESKSRACGGQLSCLQHTDASAAAAFSAFAAAVQATPEPPGAVAAANRVYTDSARVAQQFTRLSQAADVSAYASLVNGQAFQRPLTQFDTDYQRLADALDASYAALRQRWRSAASAVPVKVTPATASTGARSRDSRWITP